jgi:hypothetical protein
MFTFAAPCGPSSFVTWSLACFARSVVFVLARVRPKKKDILSGVDVVAGSRGWRSLQGRDLTITERDAASLKRWTMHAATALGRGSLNAQTNLQMPAWIPGRRKMTGSSVALVEDDVVEFGGMQVGGKGAAGGKEGACAGMASLATTFTLQSPKQQT